MSQAPALPSIQLTSQSPARSLTHLIHQSQAPLIELAHQALLVR